MTQPFAGKAEVDRATEELETASRPASQRDIAKRIVSMLNHYFVSNAPQGQAAEVASDWLEIIGDPPFWALHDACIWWIGPNNPKCSKKPLPGEIALRIKHVMEPLDAARIAIQRHQKGLGPLQAIGTE